MMEQIDRTFCDNVFDFENANLSKKKLRRKLEQLMPEFAKFVENSNIPGYKDKNFRILTALLTEPSKREGLSTDGLQFLYMRLVLGTEEDITKINMRSYDDEVDMKSYRLLLKIHDENDYLFQAISNMAHLLSRSETSNKWHDYEDNGKENLIKKITEDINNCYRRFDNELLYKGVPVRKRTVCSKTRCNVVFSTPYIYPVLPLLFVLNAIYKVKGDGNKHDKAELLKYNTSCSLTDNVYETFAISEAAEHLLERVEDVLVKHLVLYKRTVFPIRKDCYEDFDYQESKRNESTLFNRRIAFAFPFCRVRKLAADIVKECSLDDRQAAELTRNLPKYLLNKTYGESKIEEKYGKKTLDIIKGFRILADPTTYYQDKKLTEIYKADVWSKLKVSTKKMFVNPDESLKNFPEELYGFLGKYFEYISLSKYVLFHSAPYYPLYGKERALPEHYRKLVHEFKNSCRKTEDEYKEELFRDMKWETVKEMRPSLKSDILRSFTPQSAIDYLLADLKRKPNNESNLLQQINLYLEKNHTAISPLPSGSNEICAVHKLMRKTAVNVVGHYAAAMIVSLHIQELQRRNCEEE
jgi:hypothetical protein|nr:hypothetical protein [Butyricicoccus sp. OF30-11pH9A]